jgi:hypothetical protein
MPFNNDDDVRDLDDTGEWKAVLDARSTPAEVERLIADQTRVSLDSLRSQLEADADFTAEARAALLARAAVLLEPVIRTEVERAYLRLLPIH